MPIILSFPLRLSLLLSVAASKRGLVFTPNASHPQDNSVWTSSPSDLVWYYNYGHTPSPAYAGLDQTAFEFVPMLWGAPADTADTSFLTTVEQLIAGGTNVSHVLTFNEPDGAAASGGSDVSPATAAAVWIANIAPLQQLGVRVGLPACTGSQGGLPWLQQMFDNCSLLLGAACAYDFVPLHWYGSFEGLASHIGSYSAAFPNASFWVTEYGYDGQDLATTQAFFNTSAEYLDRLASVDRYAYFGAFRAEASNVGPNAAMLSSSGRLTDIGAWYLGRAATGVLPTESAAAASRCSVWAVLTLAALIVLVAD